MKVQEAIVHFIPVFFLLASIVNITQILYLLSNKFTTTML